MSDVAPEWLDILWKGKIMEINSKGELRMPEYRAYKTVKDTPNRKQRKAARKSTFEFNKKQGAVERKGRREAKNA